MAPHHSFTSIIIIILFYVQTLSITNEPLHNEPLNVDRNNGSPLKQWYSISNYDDQPFNLDIVGSDDSVQDRESVQNMEGKYNEGLKDGVEEYAFNVMRFFIINDLYSERFPAYWLPKSRNFKLIKKLILD